MSDQQSYVTIRARQPADGAGISNGASPGMGPRDAYARSATHDISRASFHVKHIGQFAQRLEDVRLNQLLFAMGELQSNWRNVIRYKNVQSLLMHWGSDDLFVLPELEDLGKCLRDDYAFGTEIYSIPSENSHLELMMRIGQLIRDHESPDTLFIVYYGGHARIDESRQSTWCATRDPGSPWLQWSAIQTLLERSKSDVLILLDCCAGAASATFPTGSSVTETISASSWDAIAPDPGSYSFTNALIEVLQEWRHRAFSAAMLHAEVLARLKHPRPITINGKHFEARSTPVHFMMTANHRAPSIELSRAQPVEKRSMSAPTIPHMDVEPMGSHVGGPVGGLSAMESAGRAASPADALTGNHFPSEPTEDTPHVMISLALEDDQRLDINAWEQWLNAFPAMAKYVKIQGVFKSHSTLVLVSMPVMVWDLLPEDPATSFIAFIRSNNIAAQKAQPSPIATPVPASQHQSEASQRRTTFGPDVPEPQSFSAHVEKRLEEYYQNHPLPNDGESAFLASNLGIEPLHLGLWFHHRRERDLVTNRLATMKVGDIPFNEGGGPLLILPADLSQLLEISQPGQVLLFDIRPQSEYQRSHIRGAINLRVPQNFIKDASLDMIGRTISEDHGHDVFSKWKEARCHYREFSVSFGQHIVDSKKVLGAEGVEQSEEPTTEAAADPTLNHERYTQWLAHVEEEDRSRTNASSPTRTTVRTEFVESQEQELEAELMARCGDLYRKIRDVQADRDPSWDDNFDVKAPMVEYLDRGLRKVRAYQPSPPQLPPSSKLAAEYFDPSPHEQREVEGYVEVGKEGDSTGAMRYGIQASTDKASPSEEPLRRGRGGGLLNKVFRRT
ncbi:hypothetical protein TASIC1_0013013600 [Trichoderma asperellum]|uniref:Tyrosine-protein phosphatase non-receptor type 6 n=1 Tax=Trichoderma asperellum TaxID=101201 RepID=A0A6V8R4F8_TRIAP|nr:hypothetical protein TASIC1_0013013600 [Trichoderma asperellum]